MATIVPQVGEQSLAAIVSAPAVESIDEVIARMEAIDALLADNDGLKWFNRLYLMVTQEVDLHPPGGAWQDAEWLVRLDVLFARRYFAAVSDAVAGRQAPSAWNALFAARFTAGIDRIQFAMAGMNAHINHDLALALLDTSDALKRGEDDQGPQHADYQAVNTLLNTVMPRALAMLASDALGVMAQDTGKVGRLLAFWNICRARDLAWQFANHLRGLQNTAQAVALSVQDSLTGALGRAILQVL